MLIILITSCQNKDQKLEGCWQCLDCFEESNLTSDLFLLKIENETIDIVNSEGFRFKYRIKLFPDRMQIHSDSVNITYNIDQVTDSVFF